MCRVLLHQQCWCWGQDIRRADGNLLLEYGFQRSRPPSNIRGSSRYQMRLSARSTITLWGFGFYYARCGRGGVYLNRYDCRPRYCHHAGFLEDVWTIEAMPQACPRHRETHRREVAYLAAKAMNWISSYEQWVLDRCGKAYRQSTLREWHEPSILPERLPEEWSRLGRSLRMPPQIRDPDAAWRGID
jgi:hypothetical protein